MRRRFAAVLIGLSGLLGGCASTVEGTGSIAADAARPGGSGAPGPGGSASPSASAPAGPGRTALQCKGKVISPTGSPYCFTAPEGFQDVSSSVTVDASIGREKYRSAVAVGDRDLVIVTVYELPVDTDPIAAETLEGELKNVLAQLAQRGFTFESTTAERGRVDGARSFKYHASQEKESLESDVYFLFRGKNEIQVNCQWKDEKADIEKGCQAVLQSLQFKSVK